MKEELLFCPLGGSGEIGMDLNFMLMENLKIKNGLL